MLRFIWIDISSQMSDVYWANWILPGDHLEGRSEASLCACIQEVTEALLLRTADYHTQSRAWLIWVQVSKSRKWAPMRMKTGVRFTKEEPLGWKKGWIQLVEAHLSVCDGGQQGPWGWPRVMSVSPWFCRGSNQARPPAPSAGNSYSPSGLNYPPEMQLWAGPPCPLEGEIHRPRVCARLCKQAEIWATATSISAPQPPSQWTPGAFGQVSQGQETG